VSNLIEADLLVMLTDQPGLFTADPRIDPSASLISEVTTPDIPEALWRAAGGTATGLGTGGMVTKLQAADLARRSGAMVVITQGGQPGVLLRLAFDEALGTRFFPLASIGASRKRYILAGGRSVGKLTIDEGAANALRNGGSLLPVGVRHFEGRFERGDTVSILDTSGREVARGLVNYARDDVKRILGKQSDQIEAILGFAYGDEVIHRDNMVLL
jgi:glutamate 5-kinase